MEAPWSDCKVAYGIEDPDRLWRWCDGPTYKSDLPAGWSLDETDCSGARCVAVFRIDGVPRIEDGQAVLAMLRRLGVLRAPRRRAA